MSGIVRAARAPHLRAGRGFDSRSLTFCNGAVIFLGAFRSESFGSKASKKHPLWELVCGPVEAGENVQGGNAMIRTVP